MDSRPCSPEQDSCPLLPPPGHPIRGGTQVLGPQHLTERDFSRNQGNVSRPLSYSSLHEIPLFRPLPLWWPHLEVY